jgi:hypothetical protein
MKEFRWIIEYLDIIPIGKEFTIEGILDYQNIMSMHNHENNLHRILFHLNKIGILSDVKTIYYYNDTVFKYYTKLKDVPFPKYFTYDVFKQIINNNNFIKTFERKCKLKMLKNDRN